MAWTVMYDVMQWVDVNGDPASGYVIKAYLPGTTTATSIAIDKNGGSPQATITLNAEGKPEVSGNEVMLFIDRDYKWAVFENASDAAANSNPYAGFYDNIPQANTSSSIDYDGNATLEQKLNNLDVDDYAALRAITSSQLVDGDSIRVTDDGIAGPFVVKTGTVTDNGGTLIVFSDDSNRYAERLYDSSSLNSAWFGLSTSETAANNKTAMDNVITASFTLRKSVFVPMGCYECDAWDAIAPSGTQRTFHMYGDFASRTGEIIPTSSDSIKQFAALFYFPNVTGTDVAIEFGTSGGSTELHRPIVESIYILGPTLEAGTPTNNNTGIRITDGVRSPIFRDVNISQFRIGMKTEDVFVFTSYSLGISRCQVGLIQGDVSNRMAHYDLVVRDCTYGMFVTGSGSTELYSPWFEAQGPVSTREMEYAIVIGGSSSASEDAIKDFTIFGGWFEQIQKEMIYVGAYDDGTGAGSGATPNLISSPSIIDRIRIHGDGHFDSIGADVSSAKIKIDASASNVADGAVRIYSDLGNWDFSQINGPSEKVKSANNFESHTANGYPVSKWVTDKDAGSGGGLSAGFKSGIPDAAATTFINFSSSNGTFGAVFRITYEIISNTERSVCAGDVIVTLGRKSGLATQGGVGTVNNTTVNISSTETNSAPTFALAGVQAKDTVDATTETIGLQVTQDNTNSSDATISYTVEQVTGTRQSGVGSNYTTVSQA